MSPGPCAVLGASQPVSVSVRVSRVPSGRPSPRSMSVIFCLSLSLFFGIFIPLPFSLCICLCLSQSLSFSVCLCPSICLSAMHTRLLTLLVPHLCVSDGGGVSLVHLSVSVGLCLSPSLPLSLGLCLSNLCYSPEASQGNGAAECL